MPHQIATQTQILQRIALENRFAADPPIFAAAVFAKNAPISPLPGMPVIVKITAAMTDPTRLPSQHTIHSFATCPQVTVFFRPPIVMTRLLPVKSSAPPIVTKQRPTEKTIPQASFVA